jgi:transposase-like protein
VEEKQQALEEKDKALEQEKQRAEQLEKQTINAIKKMISNGMDIEQIKQIFQIDEEFLKKYNLIP